jgi:Cu2+-exporting ATPase
LAEADHVVFDKTGTLTQAVSAPAPGTAAKALAIASAMGAQSRHPYSQALALALRGSPITVGEVREHVGQGLEAVVDGETYRLGRSDWALREGRSPGVVLSRDGRLAAVFSFREQLRPGAREVVGVLKAAGLPVEILSGDQDEPVRQFAVMLGVPHVGGVPPGEKVARLSALAAGGSRVLMVGDGLNDAPALAAAHVSMAPASAADIGRNAADIVLLRDDLRAVAEAIEVARRAALLVRQNLAFAVIYNLLAVPVAILGLATPLIAAIAMSASSILVVANALRLARAGAAGAG